MQITNIFKENSQQLQDYASNAYKTAGLSANDYMETVTSFSASLISSLGGDTEKAVKYADMAITDMSDNANKMGTDMESIQNAYQGFAKQNYTMLDNLKLGYGGTKSEMERLLADAEAISGIEYDVSSYADVVSAIHVIQESMGIAGTTALEAEETISGSLNAFESAFQNLLVGFGNADADMEQLSKNMVDTFITPVIENIVKALPIAIEALLDAISDLLPTLLATVTDLFTQVLNALMNLLPTLIPVAVDSILTIVNALIENLPLLVDAAVQLIAALVDGLGQAMPELIPAAVNAITTIVQGLVDNLPMLLDAALQLILGLAQGLLEAIPQLIEALPTIILAIVDFVISAIPQIIDAGIQLLTSLVTALPEIITAIKWDFKFDSTTHTSGCRLTCCTDSKSTDHYYHHCGGNPSNHFKYRKCLDWKHRQDHYGRGSAICSTHSEFTNHCGRDRKSSASDYWRHRQSIYKLHGFHRDGGWQHCKRTMAGYSIPCFLVME